MRPPYCFQDSFPGQSLQHGLQMPGRQMEALCQRLTRERPYARIERDVSYGGNGESAFSRQE